jgi:hypothetical protein
MLLVQDAAALDGHGALSEMSDGGRQQAFA